jgi:hypothetical protein
MNNIVLHKLVACHDHNALKTPFIHDFRVCKGYTLIHAMIIFSTTMDDHFSQLAFENGSFVLGDQRGNTHITLLLSPTN